MDREKPLTNMKLKDGCPGCGRYWYFDQPDDCPPEKRNQEGQCNRCKRCLECCEKKKVPYSCRWRYESMSTAKRIRHDEAYKRWVENENILGHNRRIR